MIYISNVGRKALQKVIQFINDNILWGNIVGVATAIISGGPGAVFWMWLSAFVGMFTNFAENVLGIYYRKKGKDGEYRGGPMYYISEGLGWKWLAILFAIFCMFAA